MRHFTSGLKRFLAEEDGPTAVEYAVMLAFIITLCIAAIGTVGQNTAPHFQDAANALTGP